MPARRVSKPVPKFSSYEFKLAELCALDLWNGIDYETGKISELSDEELLIDFAIPFQLMRKSSNSINSIDEFSIRRLIRIGKLKALFRSTQPTNFNNGISTISQSIIPMYNAWRNKTSSTDSIKTVELCIKSLGASFVTNPNPTKRGNYRIPLASRILFFTTPDLPIFNFSNELAEAMKFQKRPQVAITFYINALSKGLLLNKAELKKLKMPQPKLLDITLWKRIEKHKWWHRRVLDLALMLHFGVASARPELLLKAKKIVANQSQSIQPIPTPLPHASSRH